MHRMLRKLFGPSRKEIWQKLSSELDGRFVAGGFAKGDKIEILHAEWKLTLDTYVVHAGNTHIPYTRMRAPFVNPDSFRFTIYRRGFFTDIAKWFGMQDIEIGDAQFDEAFVIKGTESSRLVALFSSARLRELISGLREVHLTVKDSEGYFGPKFPPDVDELCYHVPGRGKDVEQIKQLFEVFSETLDQLCRVGAAYEKAAEVELR